MASVLVVDDSVVDRTLVRGLLQERTSLHVHEAKDGLHALEVMDSLDPDIVLTDMHMPEMNGLDLVHELRQRHTKVPVVLMTAKGNEELAIAAMRAGAASYVPKTTLQKQLASTVMQVLSIARGNEDRDRMMQCVRRASWELELTNDTNLMGPLISMMQSCLKELEVCDQAGSLHVGMVLEAAMSNAIYHGNLELTREQLENVSYDLFAIDEPTIVEQRQNQPPYCDRRVRFTADIHPDEATFVIADEGPGFDHANMKLDPETLGEHRGMSHIQIFADEVKFNDRGNEITIKVRRK